MNVKVEFWIGLTMVVVLSRAASLHDYSLLPIRVYPAAKPSSDNFFNTSG